MSTRAIIALPVEGGYITAWNWNDGAPSNLGRELRRYFKDKNQVRELIEQHSFSVVCGEKDKQDMLSLFPESVTEEQYTKLSNSRYVHKLEYMGDVVAGNENGFFKNIEEMLEQDLNYVYVFENGKWRTYK